MDLRVAQALILGAAENPEADVNPAELAVAVSTVLVRNELLGASPKTVTLTYLAQEAN